MDNYDLERLVNQCKSNDVDAKIDAVTKLQQAFEAGSPLTDAEGLINALKSCLRTSNQHLVTATLTALPSFIPLLVTGKLDNSDAQVDVNLLRQILTAFLPTGGLIDRLGDNRERAREKARESLVALGGLAFRCAPTSLLVSTRGRDAGKGPETPMMIWERFLREGGLQSKVWRVREQTLLAFTHIRRLYPTFPLKPYLPHLVELLEDTDGTVRECARQSVVELFTGPSVTDAARADLKKEMTRKNVRKTIVDSVTQKLMLGSSRSGSGLGSPGMSDGGSESGEPLAKKEYIPPSLKLMGRVNSSTSQNPLSRTVSHTASTADTNSRPGSQLGSELPPTPVNESGEIEVVYIASIKDLENEFAQMLKYFEGKETEQNWAARERSIIRLRGMLKGDAHIRYAETFLSGLKGGILDASFKTLASLRTTVATNTCNLYSELAVALGSNLDPVCESLFNRLHAMAILTKKIVAILSQQVLDTLMINTTPQPKMIISLLTYPIYPTPDKNVSARQYSINHLKVYMEAHGQRSKHAIETSGSLDILDKTIKKALGDNNPGVRESARTTFWVFESLWEDRAAVIMGSLDSSARKMLEKVCPNPNKVTNAPATPKPKKGSVAAAIAASRAKAKAIATAPPTLRHQATSTSHTLQSSILSTSPTSPPQQTAPGSPKEGVYTIRRPASRPLSPSSPPSRRPAAFSASQSYSGFAPSNHSRTVSGVVPASPTFAHKRFASSQLSSASPSPTSLESAAKIALPESTRNSLDGGYSPPVSPRQYKTRLPSPSRIPSPSRSPIRRHETRASIMSIANADPFTLPRNFNGVDESLLLAQTIPLPEDSESEDDSHMLSFSAPYEKYHMSIPKTNASGQSVGAGSPPSNAPAPIVEDAMRARAEQAESAAERLLELVEPDDDTVSPIPESLLPSNGLTPKPTKITVKKSKVAKDLPSTPSNKRASVLRQAALFKDSPAHKKPVSLVDVLHERKHYTGWWVKRINLIDKASPLGCGDQASQLAELKTIISSLEDGTADVGKLKRLALICANNPVQDDSRTPFSYSDSHDSFKGKSLESKKTFWEEERTFTHMFNALMTFLTLARTEEELEYGLIAIWEILDNLSSLVEGREADIFTRLLQVRFCSKTSVLEATNTIRDALVERIEPVYGITTIHASLRGFHAESLAEGMAQEAKASSYAFGLIALGKFILRLPAEVLEDELPRLKMTLTTALSDTTSLVVRESAATCIVASQLVLRDETHLFTLLDGLPDEKKNLLTYLFDKHGARGSKTSNGAEKLEKEMRRLDGRTNTPPRAR